MRRPWGKRRCTEQIDQARQMAEQQRRDLERVRRQWPAVNRISAELREQSERNHFGELLEAAMQRRHA